MPLYNPVSPPSLLESGIGLAVVATVVVFIFVGAELLMIRAIKRKRDAKKTNDPQYVDQNDMEIEEEADHDTL